MEQYAKVKTEYHAKPDYVELDRTYPIVGKSGSAYLLRTPRGQVRVAAEHLQLCDENGHAASVGGVLDDTPTIAIIGDEQEREPGSMTLRDETLGVLGGTLPTDAETAEDVNVSEEEIDRSASDELTRLKEEQEAETVTEEAETKTTKSRRSKR